MRRFMLKQLPAIGYAVEEGPLLVSDLLAADEIFLTNALHLLRPVKRCDNQEYTFRHSTAIYKALGEKWPHAAQLSG
jgi:branched-subunit amino acid aminotransferase/4-amino-4-deoxychorismate lyase